MDSDHQSVEPLLWGETTFVRGLRKIVAVFDPLQEACDSDLYKLIQVAGRDCQKLNAFQQGIALVLCFLEYPLVEPHPGLVAAEKESLDRFFGSLFRAGRVSGSSLGGCHRGLKDYLTCVNPMYEEARNSG